MCLCVCDYMKREEDDARQDAGIQQRRSGAPSLMHTHTGSCRALHSGARVVIARHLNIRGVWRNRLYAEDWGRCDGCITPHGCVHHQHTVCTWQEGMIISDALREATSKGMHNLHNYICIFLVGCC